MYSFVAELARTRAEDLLRQAEVARTVRAARAGRTARTARATARTTDTGGAPAPADRRIVLPEDAPAVLEQAGAR